MERPKNALVEKASLAFYSVAVAAVGVGAERSLVEKRLELLQPPKVHDLVRLD